jgi:hypothetical protein
VLHHQLWACSFRSAQAATLLEFLIPPTNCFVHRWFCVVLGPKLTLHHHNWLSFGKFQDTERFLIPCPRHVSSPLPPTGETCKYARAPVTQTNLEKFSTYCYAPLCCVCLGCCATEFGNPKGTYEFPSIYMAMIRLYVNQMHTKVNKVSKSAKHRKGPPICKRPFLQFGSVNGFINHLQVVTTNNYYTIADLHNLQSLHTNLLSLGLQHPFPGIGFITQEL